MEFTVTGLARVAGANPRSVQHWAANGILRPYSDTNRAGTGTRRLFSKDEAVVACLMQKLLDRQTPVGEMDRISRIIRGHLLSGMGGGRRALSLMLRGTRAWLVIFSKTKENVGHVIMLDNPTKFAEIFSDMQDDAVALVIDMSIALSGLQAELTKAKESF